MALRRMGVGRVAAGRMAAGRVSGWSVAVPIYVHNRAFAVHGCLRLNAALRRAHEIDACGFSRAQAEAEKAKQETERALCSGREYAMSPLCRVRSIRVWCFHCSILSSVRFVIGASLEVMRV